MFKDNRSLINKRIATFLSVIEDEAKPVYGFSRDNVVRRIKQIILRDYNSTILTLFNDEIPCSDFKLCSNKEIKITNDKRNQINFSLKQCLFYFLSGLKVLIITTLFSLVGMLRKSENKQPRKKVFCLGFALKDLIPYENISEAFLRFCNEGPLKPLSEKRNEYWVEDSVKHQEIGGIQFTVRNPILSCFLNYRLSCKDALIVCFKNMRLFGLGLSLLLRRDKSICLFRDLSFVPVLEKFVEHDEISDIIVTNSSYLDVYLWLAEPMNKAFKTHMVWYSGGLGWYDYQSNEFYMDCVENTLMEIGTHWVWTETQKLWLSERHSSGVKFEVVGPILFYLPREREKNPNSKIILFDISPMYQEQFIRRYGSEVYYYNQFSTVLRFAEDILDVVKRQGLTQTHEILYKAKRRVVGHHVDEYFQKLDEFEEKGLIEIIENRCDLWELVDGADMVFVLAPSSPVYLGQHFNIPSYYYDPLSVLRVEEGNTYNGASLIRGKKELEKVIHSLVNKGNENESGRTNSNLF